MDFLDIIKTRRFSSKIEFFNYCKEVIKNPLDLEKIEKALEDFTLSNKNPRPIYIINSPLNKSIEEELKK